MIHVALLRGLNVGSANRIKMPALIDLFTRAGGREVRTFIQSGNVLFTASDAAAKKVPAAVAKLLAAEFKITSPVVLRSAAQLAAAVKANPFLAQGAALESLHVGFLAEEPGAGVALDPDRSPGDHFALLGRELYLHLPNGLGKSKLTNAWFDSKLKTISTFRNWNTVLELTRLSAAPG
jgi:uncharacterized protein (DUF1697 family)